MHFPTDVMGTGVWGALKNRQDPEIKGLVTSLSSTVLASRAPATMNKYLGGFLRWKHSAKARREVAVFPVKGTEFVLYLQHLGDTAGSKSAVEKAVHSVGCVHQLEGYPPMSDLPFVNMVSDGLQRKLAKLKVCKEPVTREMILALVNSLGKTPSLADVRLAVACLLAFSAFLRYDELSRLRCCDITFDPQRMTVRIVSSKLDQYRQGDRVIVARTGSSVCPVAMLERYYAMAALPKSWKLRLFRGIVITKSGERFCSHDSLSYTRLRELFLSKLSELGFDPKQFGLHSLRSGGASAAANAGVPDRLFHRCQPSRFRRDSTAFLGHSTRCPALH